MQVLPNLVYIGPDKAGSTWLFDLLSQHPDVFMTPAKDLYFFDRYYHKGIDWYARQFEQGAGRQIVGEISHDYLYSRPAAQRLHQHVPETKLLVCLREPCDRTFSAYLHLVKQGLFRGTFEEALEATSIVNKSQYGKHLCMYSDYFDRRQLYGTAFDDLRQSPQAYADRLFQQLGVPTMELPASLHEKSLPAGRSRSILLTKSVKAMADLARDAGVPSLVGRVKSSSLVQQLLYARYREGEKPRMSAETRKRLRDVFAPDVELLDRILGTDLAHRWGYAEPSVIEPTLGLRQRCASLALVGV